MIQSVFALFGNVLLPILLVVGLGALVQRFHPLHIPTLSKLQIYLFVPAFLFVRVFDSTLSWREIAGIAGAVLLAELLLAIPLWVLLRRLQVRQNAIAVVVLSGVVFNAGNFGIPLAERAWGSAGGAVQALIAMMSNLTLWGLGYGLMAVLAGQKREAVWGYLKLPMLYVLALAFALRAAKVTLPSALGYPLHLIADGLVPLALVTLGAQLAQQARWPRWRVIVPLLALKLLAMPLVMAGVVWALGLWPWPGALLIVASAAPTAVNTFLMTLEQGGDAELAADCVFWTTLVSAVTVTLVLAVVQLGGGAPPGAGR